MSEIKIVNVDVDPVVAPGTVVYGVTPEGLDVTHTMAQIAEANFLQNGIVTIGSTFLDEGLRTYTFGGWQWRINGVVKTPALFETDSIPEEEAGESRAYVVVGKEDSTFQVIAGDATTDLPIDPPTPPGTIYLTRFVSSGAVIGEPEEPIVGTSEYKKIYLAEQRITEEVLEVTLPTDGRTNFIFTVGGFDMQGFVVPEGYEHLFAGKLFFLYNASDDPITLLFDEGTADILFNFKDAADFILEPDTKAILQYSPLYGLQLVSGGGEKETSAQKTQNNITFSKGIGDFFGTSDEPITGALTIDTTGAVLGGNACVFYNNSTFSVSPTPDLIVGDFVPDELNIIFFLRAGGGYLIANIINGGEVAPAVPAAPTSLSLTEGTIGGIPDAPTDLILTEGTI